MNKSLNKIILFLHFHQQTAHWFIGLMYLFNLPWNHYDKILFLTFVTSIIPPLPKILKLFPTFLHKSSTEV